MFLQGRVGSWVLGVMWSLDRESCSWWQVSFKIHFSRLDVLYTYVMLRIR